MWKTVIKRPVQERAIEISLDNRTEIICLGLDIIISKDEEENELVTVKGVSYGRRVEGSEGHYIIQDPTGQLSALKPDILRKSMRFSVSGEIGNGREDT